MPCFHPLVAALLMLCAGRSSAARYEPAGVLTIRIHDYTQIERNQVWQAQRHVADIYRRIGVRLDWRAPAQPVDIHGLGIQLPDAADMTVVILTAAMTERLRVATDVAGFAPITRTGGGRVAFVLGERTRAVAVAGRVDHASVLAGVIAHELAHLLMPERSHSSFGVMRPHWTPDEFRTGWRRGFSPAEAASIRRSVTRMRAVQPRAGDWP
jgi:hypothetical protein